MCEALICVKDIGGIHDPKPGDVISLAEDGHDWSPAELGRADHPNFPKYSLFRVVKFPNVTGSQASRLMTPEPIVDHQNPSPYLQFRAFFIDESKLASGDLKTYWNDDGRTDGFISVDLTASQLNGYITQRTPVPF